MRPQVQVLLIRDLEREVLWEAITIAGSEALSALILNARASRPDDQPLRIVAASAGKNISIASSDSVTSTGVPKTDQFVEP